MRKTLKYAGYAVFGIFIFLFLTYLNLPYQKLKDKFFLQIEKQSGLIIETDELKTTLPFGFKLSDVQLSHRSLTIPGIRIPTIKLAPSFASLVTLKPKINFDIDLKQGGLSGFFQVKGANIQKLGLDAYEIPLESEALKKQTNLDLSGLIDGNISLLGNPQNPQTWTGNAKIHIQKFILGKAELLNIKLPQIRLSEIVLHGNLDKERLSIENFNLGRPKEDLEAQISGEIIVNARHMTNSQLNLNVAFKLSKQLEDEFAIFLPFIATALGKDGFYRLKITGLLSAPVATPQRS